MNRHYHVDKQNMPGKATEGRATEGRATARVAPTVPAYDRNDSCGRLISQNEMRHKICGRVELILEVQRRQTAGERAVFTNGCFDLLHVGHVRYLQEARALGDFLIVGLNNDESVRRLKGAYRPLVPEMERAEILAALACIDYVTIFSEPTAEALVNLLRPAIYVKGADYADTDSFTPDLNRLPEAGVVQAYGGTVQLIPYLPNHSTSALIAAIQRLSSTKG